MTKSRAGIFAAAVVACVAGTAFAEKDFGDFYTRAWYMVVDNPGPAKSLSWRVFDVCGPAEHHNNVEKNPSFTIRRETDVRRIDTPWMEVNFHTNRPISVVRIRPSRKPGEEFDLYGARIFLLDRNRKIVWHHRIWNTDGQVDYDASAEFSDRDMLGQTLPEYKAVGHRVSAPLQPPPADMRLHLVKGLFNPEAMARAINAYAVKYPDLFPDKDALLAELAAIKKGGTRSCASADTTRAAAIDALSRKVFLRLPAFRRFSDFLAIRRGDGNAMGLPQNWQGNTSVPVSGYSNALVRVSLAKDGATAERTLHESDSFIGDVALDWDLKKVAFSTRKLAEAATGRRAPRNGAHGGIGESGWCVAEMELSAPGRLREITPTDTPDIDYYDPMYLPDGKMFLMGTVGFQGVPCVGGADHVGNLMLRDTDGRLRRLSFDQDNNWHPVMLPNGRCLYLRWEYTDSAHYFARILMTMNPDGSDQQEFYGSNSYWPNAMFYAKPIPGSSTKFMAVVTGHHGVSRKGELVLFDVAKGRRETAGAVQKLPGWGKPVENVTADRLVNDARQFFLHPYPLSDEGALVALQDYSLAKHFFIAYVDVFDNQYPLLVSADDSVNYLEPLPIEKREKPFEVAKRVDETQKTARVNIVSVYDGPGLAGVPKGVVKKLRLFNYEYCSYMNHGKECGGHYCIGMEGPWDVRVILGEVDVEEDGSVLFECPANVPIAIQPLDAEGKHLQEMRSWFAAMPGETLSCLGCHQDQNVAPPSGTRTRASFKPPQKIKPWYGPRRGFAFERETLNVIERRCAGCHDGNPAKKNAIGQPLPKFAGTPRDVYDALHPYVRRNGPEGDYHLLTPGEFHADTSELWQRLVLGHHGVRLSTEERDRILAWMNMNVPFFGTWSETGQPDPEIIKRRRQLAKQVANDDFDPEKVVNPYAKAAFEKPDASAAATDRRTAKFDPLAGVCPGESAPAAGEVLDLGNGSKISLKPIPGSSAFKPFLLAETEITVAQYRAFDPSFDNGVYDMHYKDQVKRGYYMNDDPVFGSPGAVNFPAVRISHEKAEAFCRWLSKKTGREVRLPTEAEWHWAAHAGAQTPFFWGGMDADYGAFANLADVTRRELAVDGINPKPIPNPSAYLDWELKDLRFDDGVLHLAQAGSYRANAWGLKDMVGNAAEWTSTDVTFTDGVKRKVVCGGSFNDRPHRALMRWGYPAWMRPFDVGFRIVVR